MAVLKQIPIDEAIEQLVEQYRMQLEEDGDLVAKEWLSRMDELAEVVEDDEEGNYLSVEG